MELILPIQFTKKTTKTAQMDGVLITVNNFFGHLITDIDIRRYPDDTEILPTNNNVNVYQFSNSQLKYLPKDSVATLLKLFLHSNKPVYLDENTELKDWVFKTSYYSISLGMLVDLRLINFAMKTDTKILFTLQRSMNKLFETTKKATAIPDESDALIQFHDRLYISYQ